MVNQDILVSVICLTYNHSKFIERCLKGFVEQKTSFPFEVIVHDDASTDSTADIIRNYERMYPDIIKPIYETENQHSKTGGITKRIIAPKVRGKYVAYCEGDDFWTDQDKLQLQIEALEQHTDCVACFHQVLYVDINEKSMGRVVPVDSFNSGYLSTEEFMKHNFYPEPILCFPWHLSSLVIRRDVWLEFQFNPPPFRRYFDVGDQPLFFFIGTRGPVYYIKRKMSCYRRGGNNQSWVGRTLQDKDKFLKHLEVQSLAWSEVDKATDYKYHEYAIKGINNHSFQRFKATGDVKSMKADSMIELYKSMSLVKRIYYEFYPVTSRLRKIAKKLK